jgi:hypothetical protein
MSYPQPPFEYRRIFDVVEFIRCRLDVLFIEILVSFGDIQDDC